MAGNRKAYRAAGNVLHGNPNPVVVPCHRIIKSDGSLGGYGGGMIKKRKLLISEGIKIVDGKIDLKKFGWNVT